MNNDYRLDCIAEFLYDEDRKTFTFKDAQDWSKENGWNVERPSLCIQGLKARGFLMVERDVVRSIRTLGSNPHDRWYGPGSCKTFGGAGGSSIMNMAGKPG